MSQRYYKHLLSEIEKQQSNSLYEDDRGTMIIPLEKIIALSKAAAQGIIGEYIEFEEVKNEDKP